MATPPLRFAFFFENALGHVTFARALRERVATQAGIEADWFPLGMPGRGLINRRGPLSEVWTLRVATQARLALARRGSAPPYDAMLFHTETPTLLSTAVMRRIPTVVSLDATPRNFDEVGAGYGHQMRLPALERSQLALQSRPLRAARGLVAWSEWVRRSLIADYGVSPERVTVVPAGTDLDAFPHPRPPRRPGPFRILFVGAAFERKGGPLLLDALSRLKGEWEADLVTEEDIPSSPLVRVHRGVRPGDPKLQGLYREADLFALPTAADASPHVILEAMAAGLPVITCRVGAIPEMVEDGVTAILLDPGDREGLESALARLVAAPELAAAMGTQGRERAERLFDAEVNITRVVDLMRSMATGGRERSAGA